MTNCHLVLIVISMMISITKVLANIVHAYWVLAAVPSAL